MKFFDLNAIWNKIKKYTVTAKDAQIDTDTISKLATIFIANPESLILYRGEKDYNRGGLHFTPDREWANGFGETVLEGRLPVGSKVKLITTDDLDDAINHGLVSDHEFHWFLLTKGYDAIIGHDVMNNNILDIVVHPKHLENFKPIDGLL